MTVCKLCRSCRVKSKYKLGFLMVGQCEDCHFTFVTSDVGDHELLQMYSSKDAVAYLATRENRQSVKFKKRLSEIGKLYKGQVVGLHLCDVGCGVGDFCYLASRNGINAVGIDISEPAIKLARERYGEYAEYYNVNIDDMVQSKNRVFDVVTLWDVIEHCKDPHKIIAYCKTLVKKDGFICINTPNCDSLYDKLADVAYRLNLQVSRKMLKQRYSTAHLQLWTQSTLKKLLRYYDLEVVISKRIRELTMVPSGYIKAMGANNSAIRLVQCIDGIIEKIWPVRNKVLVYAQAK